MALQKCLGCGKDLALEVKTCPICFYPFELPEVEKVRVKYKIHNEFTRHTYNSIISDIQLLNEIKQVTLDEKSFKVSLISYDPHLESFIICLE